MLYKQGRAHQCRGARGWMHAGQASALACVATSIVLTGTIPATASAQKSAATVPLVFDDATVVDVEHGKLVPSQRVVVVGNHIETVGNASAVKIPKDAQIVNARGKYLIPGLWDMHTHPDRRTSLLYPLFIAYGVTGIRDGGSHLTLDSLKQLRREVLAGTRVGPPREIFSGPQLNAGNPDEGCVPATRQTCIRDSADAVRIVDSLKAAGADMLKMYHLQPDLYYIIAAKARSVGMPFGGHLYSPIPMDVSDSGASFLDHGIMGGDACFKGTLDECKPMVERFKRNGTYWVPTLTAFSMNPFNRSYNRKKTAASSPVMDRLNAYVAQFWEGTAPSGNWLKDAIDVNLPDSDRTYRLAEQAGMPIVAGTDVSGENQKYEPAGVSLHGELASYVAEGLSPLTALQAATLNPAKVLHATDSLGTVAAGKLADLVLLDADPLADITNTTTIRAVVANGRYFDRAALDKVVADVRAIAEAQEVFADKGFEINP